MPKKNTPRRIKLWLSAELKQLRTLAGRLPAAQIARRLKRTESAVRRKAFDRSISLARKAR